MKKKITALALAVCILVVGIVGATTAYFTDKKEATNTFTFGEGVKITLTESSIDYNDGAGAEGGPEGAKLYGATNGTGLDEDVTGGLHYDNVIPGRYYSKAPHVTLKNSGKSDPAYIVVTATYKADRPFKFGGQATVKDLLSEEGTTNADVEIVPAGNTVFFYFTQPVQPGTVVTPFQWVQLDPSVNNQDTDFVSTTSIDADIEINAFAVLAAGFNDCKTAFNAAFGNDANFDGILGEKKSVKDTADATGAATFTLDTVPAAASNEKTTVNLTGLTAGSDYTLDATTYDAETATVPTAFTVTDGSGVIAALDLSLTDALGNKALFADGEATVVTYIATGLEDNPTVKYTGDDGAAQPTFVSYDSTTGKLVFKTSHFSNFAVLVNEAAYNKTTNTAYKTLADAVEKVENGQTIVMLKDLTGAGIGTFKNPAEGQVSVKNFTIDFNKHTYTVSEPPVGSAGTVTQAFHLEWNGSGDTNVKVTLKNGALTSTGDKVKMLIQNYCDLTLENMTIDGTHLPGSGRYVLSNNCGTTIIKNSTITAKEGDFAFDSCKFGTYEIPTVKLNNATINGNVELTGGKLEFVGDLALADGRIEIKDDAGGTIDLNGKKIVRTGGTGNGSAFNVVKGEWIIKNGTIDCTGVTGTTNNQGDPYNVETDAITVRSGAEATLEGLKIDVVSKTGACAYAFAGGKIYVKSGTYSNAASEQYANDNKMLLNQADNTDQLIFVSGGTFYGANPANGDNSGKPISFLAEGATVTGGTGYWTVTTPSVGD